jgi:hypothetical protein
MLRDVIIVTIFLFRLFQLNAQDTIRINAQDTIRMELDGHPVNALIKNGDTIYISYLEDVSIQPYKRIASKRDLRQYRRLIYNVKKVYPYAKLAGEKYGEVTNTLKTLETAKAQREYIKQVEKEIIADFEDDLKDLTITQGRILIKLIDRETSYTSYEVVKDLRGSFQAAFWQVIARLFGSNLKVEFDAAGEDKMVDEIMIMIENGQL